MMGMMTVTALIMMMTIVTAMVHGTRYRFVMRERDGRYRAIAHGWRGRPWRRPLDAVRELAKKLAIAVTALRKVSRFNFQSSSPNHVGPSGALLVLWLHCGHRGGQNCPPVPVWHTLLRDTLPDAPLGATTLIACACGIPHSGPQGHMPMDHLAENLAAALARPHCACGSRVCGRPPSMKVKPTRVVKQSQVPGVYWHCGKMGWVQRQALHPLPLRRIALDDDDKGDDDDDDEDGGNNDYDDDDDEDDDDNDINDDNHDDDDDDHDNDDDDDVDEDNEDDEDNQDNEDNDEDDDEDNEDQDDNDNDDTHDEQRRRRQQRQR